MDSFQPIFRVMFPKQGGDLGQRLHFFQRFVFRIEAWDSCLLIVIFFVGLKLIAYLIVQMAFSFWGDLVVTVQFTGHKSWVF